MALHYCAHNLWPSAASTVQNKEALAELTAECHPVAAGYSDPTLKQYFVFIHLLLLTLLL